MTNYFLLRDVIEDDIPIFFAHQLDEEANHMAAFTTQDPTNQEAFFDFWKKIRANETIITKTIVYKEHVVGSVLSYVENGKPEVSYWIGKEFWGQEMATRALLRFLISVNQTRPIYARVAKNNHGSKRVLEKCGFEVIDEIMGFANARGKEIEELLLELRENNQIEDELK